MVFQLPIRRFHQMMTAKTVENLPKYDNLYYSITLVDELVHNWIQQYNRKWMIMFSQLQTHTDLNLG